MLTWFLLLAQAAAPASCTQALAAVPAARACAASRHGVALAETQAEADRLLAEAVAGEARFLAAFGRDPTPYAVYVFDNPAAIASAAATLRQIGLTSTLPVPSAASLAERRARIAAAGAHLPPGAKVITRAPASSDEPRDVADPDKIPHELGHLWYQQLFWAGAARPAGDRYGGAAPDWLDEVAAILMESDTRAAIHRHRFSDGRDADPERARNIPPEIALAEFVTMPHPASASLPEPGKAPIGPIRVTSAPSLFYAQARVFADYLIQRSGDSRIFAAISQAMQGGQSFADWVAQSGTKHKLPPTLAAMDADWQGWLTGRFGPPVAR
jgi:hypothetical protein